MKWFKFYGQDFLTDSKLGALNPLQRLMWVALLCVASQDEKRTGIIKFLTEDRLMDLCGIRVEDFENLGARYNVTLETFCNMGLVTCNKEDNEIIVTNFNLKQIQQSTSAERVANWRAKNKGEMGKVIKNNRVTNVTNVMLQSNGRIDKRRIEKNRIYKREGNTPAQEAEEFFNGNFEPILKEFVEKTKISEDALRQEFTKFILYWTEKNKSGTKQRWEQQSTFEVKKRLVTWLGRISSFNTKKETKIL